MIGTRVVNPHHNKHMLELGPDVPGSEGQRARLLEDDRHDVVTDVTFP